MGARVITTPIYDDTVDPSRLAIVLLNWSLPPITAHLWQRAAIRICADGGANRLHDELPAMHPGEAAEAVRARYIPTLIKGDLDSIRPDVLGFYRGLGVEAVDLSADQDSTDLMKCLEFVRRTARADVTVVVLGAHGGRLDHTLANLSTLHAYRDLDILLCGEGNLTRLLPAGRVLIRPDRRIEGPSCGLVPMLGPAKATSRGLRWNLERTEMRIGGLVSTSNLIQGDEVEVESDSDLIWTTQMHPMGEAPPGG